MRYKVVPEPRSVAFLRNVQQALPLVPGSVEDCCTRIRDRTDLQSRDAAREYLTFVQALGLASEGDVGFYRSREEPDDSTIAQRFEARVFVARELLDALADGPLTAAACFDALREAVPQWERDRHADWEGEWRTRTRHLLGWAVKLGLVESSNGRYKLVREG
jgi:hypothetical protein